MRYSLAIASLVTLAAAQVNTTSTDDGTITTTTVIYSDYTTYCPTPTTFIHKNVTYTATSDQTLTITNCPCVITTHLPPPTTIIPVPESTGPGGVPIVPAPVPGESGVPAPPGESGVPAPPGVVPAPGEPTVIQPPPETTLAGVTPVPGPPGGGGENPTNVPTGPSAPAPVPTAGAVKNGVGALLVVAGAAMVL